MVSSKIISSLGDDEGISIIKTSDGGVAVSGNLDGGMGLLKFDVNLTLQWQKQYDTTGESDGARLLQTSDGGFMIVGDIFNVDGNSAGYLVKTDSKGNVVFSKQYFDFDNNEILDVAATKDGNYALLANISTDVSNDDTSFNNDSTYVVKITPDGSVIWARYINTGTSDQLPFSLLAASDGGIVIAGSVAFKPVVFFGDSTTTLSQIMMSKFDASGTLLWSKSIAGSDTSETQGYSVAEDNSGNYIFGGLAYIFNSDSSFANFSASLSSYLVKLSSSGSLIFTKTFDNNTNVFSTGLFSIANTSDGGFVSSGVTYANSNSDSNTIYGSIYKFTSSFGICGNAGSFGNIANTGTGVSASITNNSLSTVANDIAVTTVSAGSVVNLCNVLPLDILSFNATLQNKVVHLEWKTANEINTDYFSIERSSNAVSFMPIQKVMAKGYNSNVQTYIATDLQPIFGKSYYRLKEVDKDGKTTYSNVAAVTVSANGTIVISPNPVHDNIRVLLQSENNSSFTFQVIDMSGRLLAMQNTSANAGTNIIAIPASFLTKGLYVLKVIGNNTVQSIKFVKE